MNTGSENTQQNITSNYFVAVDPASGRTLASVMPIIESEYEYSHEEPMDGIELHRGAPCDFCPWNLGSMFIGYGFGKGDLAFQGLHFIVVQEIYKCTYTVHVLYEDIQLHCNNPNHKLYS